MTVDLDALEALAKAATPGPWNHHRYELSDDMHAIRGAINDQYNVVIYAECEPEDAEYISAANPSTVLALIAELRQERERAALLEEWGADIINERTQAEAGRDRLRKAVEEVLDALDPTTGDGGAADEARRILRAALDKEDR